MCEKKVFVQYSNNINDVIKQPLLLTQRIKFTCFDVSSKFIVFGATSGGIYIYSIEPCHFIKLIPTKEGAATIVSISPDENIIAVASSKGFILMVENFMSEINTFYKTFTEHGGNIISILKWHGNQLYCGDNVGKVSVTDMSNNLAKVLFQSPCLSLMELDSGIVQIDCFLKYLLISTQTRTYLCDTEKEQYRQIGKKTRDGHYGACFLNKNSLNDSKLFGKTAIENNALEDTKIYCARPGARLWEANFDASVVYTHQFKNSLGVVPSTTIVRLNENSESHLDLVEFNNATEKMFESFSFAKIFVFLNKYIFTYLDQGFYIFDPESVELSYWTNHFHGIKDIKLYNNFIYVWTVSEFYIISLMTVENLAVKTLIDRQYYVCAELCAHYLEHLMTIVEFSDKIYLLSALREKLKVLDATVLLNKIMPLLDFIKENNNKIKTQRLQSGMIVLNSHLVDNHVINKYEEKPKNDQNLINSKPFQTIKEVSSHFTEKISESTKNLKEKVENLSTAVNVIAVDNSIHENKFSENCDIAIVNKSSKEEEDNMRILLEQYKINLVHESVELPVLSDILTKSTYDEVIEIFDRFISLESHDNSEQTNRSIRIWCNNQYLKLVSKCLQSIDFLDPTSKAFQYLLESFIAINFKDNLNCSCDFPLPVAHTIRVKYFTLGCAILNKLGKTRMDQINNISLKVPSLLKYVLRELRLDEDIVSLLPYLLQFSDDDLLSYFAIKMTYDHWDEAVRMMIKLGNNICVNCGNVFPENMGEFILSWTSFGNLLVKSIGGPVAIRLLKRYSKFIPSNSLDEKFYQLCIFSTVFEGMHDGLRIQAVNLANESQEDDAVKGEFNELLKNFLNKKYLQAKSLNIFQNGIINIDAKCSRCSLPFNNIILEKTVRLKCGHMYHAFCKLKKSDVCEICA